MPCTCAAFGGSGRGIGTFGRRLACASVVGLLALTPGLVSTASGQARGAAEVAAERAVAAVEAPIRHVTLYRSGVGYFQRHGVVRGDASVALQFRAEQINDILKSMTLFDLDPQVGGTVSGVMYGSKDPLERRLRSFGVDISQAPSVPQLLQQLRGTGVRVTVPDGVIDGTILGVEERQVVTARENAAAVTKEPFVNLVTRSGVRSLAISGISSFELTDQRLREELSEALAALADSRAEDSTTVEVRYHGPADKERRIAIGYVHETPVWKTTYRLILPEQGAEGSQAANGGGRLRVQGMAIVENTTDQDWTDVRLSLASGRPVGFQMPLYDPVYMPRPMLPVPGIASMMAKVFEQAMPARRRAESAAAPSAADLASNAVASQFAVSGSSGGIYRDDGHLGISMEAQPVIAGATGGEVGEQFMYTLDVPVTLARQRSAMLPILDAPVSGRRVSIYSPGDGRPNPMRGAEIKNDSGLHLMPGPVSVFDGSSYAGDAQIPHTGRNSTQLLAYAIDLDVQARTTAEFSREVRKIRIVDGLLEETIAQVNRTTYEFDNRDAARGRTILVEHPRMPGWELIRPAKPDQETDSLYRFELAMGKSESASLEVQQQMIVRQTHGLTSYSVETLLFQAQQGRASEKVVEAFRRAGELQGRVRDIERMLEALEKARAEIAQDQERLRRNMTTIDRNTDLYRRYMATLNEQENQLAQNDDERTRLRGEFGAAQQALQDYLRNLNVE